MTGTRPCCSAPPGCCVQAQKPGFLALPTEGYSVSWFVSTVLLTALGFYMWPHYFTSTFSAGNERIFRRNAIFLPLYQLVLLFVFCVGFAAVLQVPGLTGERIDESLLLVSKEEFGPFVVGLIGATGLLTALVPGSIRRCSPRTSSGHSRPPRASGA
jgi:SSS family solute:Na+ symporter